MPEYRDRTTLIFSPDHGRGSATGGKQSSRSQSADIDGAEMIWLAALGPDTPALGERHNVPPVTQSQIAATLAAFLGEDYAAAVPELPSRSRTRCGLREKPGGTGYRPLACRCLSPRIPPMKRFCRPTKLPLMSFFFVLSLAFMPQEVLAWGETHGSITRAAIKVLPAWQQDLLGKEGARLADYYCVIPDMVGRDKENTKFAMMDSRPGETYLLGLHLPAPQQPENLETLRYFMGKAVGALKAGKTGTRRGTWARSATCWKTTAARHTRSPATTCSPCSSSFCRRRTA